ncbi:hypothetical protein BGZ65_002859 [Modicella reniformis]|uniref:F-box domain-containing protein n=1 Tax=Modicella reniformis TaxID=1440133 RepID=A0A9P6IMY1_9FUNG|nr:hypothetical protein BGZ65_002859 [Modicella reniformis]
MQSTHPLGIPEIVSYVASYVRKRDLTACALVSKTWYQAFNPLIWHDISWKYGRPFLPEAIQRHSQLVRAFKVPFGVETKALHSLRFPKLVSLDAEHYELKDMNEWMMDHCSVTRLKLRVYEVDHEFWNSLLGFRHLKDLTLRDLRSWDDVDGFWQLCTHLERLEIIKSYTPHQGNLLSMRFPSIKELIFNLTDWNNVRILEFMQRCSNLTSFKYVGGEESAGFASSFSDLVTARTWSQLHSVSIWDDIAEDAILRIIEGMQRINVFEIYFLLDSFGFNAMELLRPHFSNIRVLHLRCFNESETSPMAQEILSSCPLLEQLTAPPIEASVIAKGKPWVCTRLQELKLMFVYADSTLPCLQPLVFDQLARLVRLETWCTNYSNQKPPHQVVDLTLKNGLSKLSTLRSLRFIRLGNTYQKMGQQEIDWILQHWINLENIGVSVNAALTKRLKEHGIRKWT